jgi:hypothetical protein
VESRAGQLRRIWASRYSRPVYGGDDPTERDMLLELLEHRFFEDSKQPGADDPLVQQWEKDLAEGREPDLDAR